MEQSIQKIKYKIIKHPSFGLDDMENETNELLSHGWQKISPLIPYEHGGEYWFVQEMLLISEEQTVAENGNDFQKRYDSMEQWVKDLLDINGIYLTFQDGNYYTTFNKKTTPGISPEEVLSMLKSSKHCPMDLDEEKFLYAIEAII